MVEVNGEFESTGGRKAKILTAVRNSRYAVGLDITANHVSITYTDLSGRALNHRRIRKPFVYSDDYFAELARLTEEFVKEWDVPPEKIEEWEFPCRLLLTAGSRSLLILMRWESIMYPAGAGPRKCPIGVILSMMPMQRQ